MPGKTSSLPEGGLRVCRPSVCRKAGFSSGGGGDDP